jgi:hypothetical protein
MQEATPRGWRRTRGREGEYLHHVSILAENHARTLKHTHTQHMIHTHTHTHTLPQKKKKNNNSKGLNDHGPFYTTV